MPKKRLYIPAMLLLILVIVSTCSTTPPRIETIDPGLSFPVFPDPIGEDGKAIPVLDGETVKVPLWYWSKIAEYMVEVEKAREIYEGWQDVYLAPENE
jgi:hypothetical protein